MQFSTKARARRAARFWLGLVCACAATMATLGDSRAADTAAMPSGAQLMSARGEVIGVITGRTTSFDANAATVGAYGVLSAQGYFADVLPSGALGQVLSLVYGAADCAGTPAIEQSSVLGGPLPVPGYVFTFGAPPQSFNVPANAGLRELNVVSERQRTRSGYTCVSANKRVRVYPLVANQAAQSGFVDQYAGPLAIKVLSARAVHGDDAPMRTALPVAVKDESAPGADLPPDTPQCATGCFMPYLGDHICESECANSLCGFDAGDCSPAYVERARQREARMCAPTCEESSLGDGFCDSACNVAGCDFDHGDCKRK